MRAMIRFDGSESVWSSVADRTFWYQVAALVSGTALATLALLFTQAWRGV